MLISTLNEDGTPNLAPMSSAWWLDDLCMLGLGSRSKTAENLRREGEWVLNLPSVDRVDAVDRLALTTAKDPMPQYKTDMGFDLEKHKFERAGLTPGYSGWQAASSLGNDPGLVSDQLPHRGSHPPPLREGAGG